MKYLIPAFILVLFTSCQNESVNKGKIILKITCNGAYLREKPNKSSKDIDLLKNEEVVVYLHETIFSEILDLKGKSSKGNWVYVQYKDRKGWIFSECLQGFEKISNRVYTKDFDLKERIFLHDHNVTDPNPEKCEFSCECDCGTGTIEMLDNETCIMNYVCCCGNPIEYFKGIYKSSNDVVVIDFNGKYVSEYDSETTELEDNLEPINPKPIVVEASPFSYQMKVGFCKDGYMYLYDNSDSTNIYAKIQFIEKRQESKESEITKLLKSL